MSERKVRTLAWKVDKGKFSPDPGQVIGKVLPDGKIENTNYQFDPNEINGGIAITNNSTLAREGDMLVNKANGDVFNEAKSGKGYFSKETRTFVKVWSEDPIDE